MHQTELKIIRLISENGPLTKSKMKSGGTTSRHIDNLLLGGYIEEVPHKQYTAYALTKRGEASAKQPENITPPRRHFEPSPTAFLDVAPWMKAGAVRDGADDNLLHPSRECNRLIYRDGRIVTK